MLSLGLAVALLATPSIQDQPLRVGNVAPNFTVTRLVNGDVGEKVSLSSFKGKVVVLEFWATWCPPCVASFKHLSEVAKARPDVEFLAITEEQSAKVAAFLKTRTDVQVPIVLSQDRIAFSGYGIRTIPHTVIVDKEGLVAATTRPEAVTPEALSMIEKGLDPKLPVKVDVAASFDTIKDPTKVRVEIRDSNATAAEGRSEPNRYAADGVSVEVAYLEAYQVSYLKAKFNVPEEELSHRFYFDVSVPKGQQDALRPTFRDALEKKFGYKVTKQKQTANVIVLRRVTGADLKMTPSKTSPPESFFKHDRMKSRGSTMANVAEFLESVTGRIVIDETGITGGQDFDMEWVPGSAESLMDAFKKIGLELVKDKREVEMTVFSKT